MSFLLPANAPLLVPFRELPDPRKQRNRSYPLIDIIAVTIMGIMLTPVILCLFTDGLCLNGVPSHDALNTVFRLLDSKSFQECFMRWVRTIAATVEGVIAIDRKTTLTYRGYEIGQRGFFVSCKKRINCRSVVAFVA
jgi:hypothetical protein